MYVKNYRVDRFRLNHKYSGSNTSSTLLRPIVTGSSISSGIGSSRKSCENLLSSVASSTLTLFDPHRLKYGVGQVSSSSFTSEGTTGTHYNRNEIYRSSSGFGSSEFGSSSIISRQQESKDRLDRQIFPYGSKPSSQQRQQPNVSLISAVKLAGFASQLQSRASSYIDLNNASIYNSGTIAPSKSGNIPSSNTSLNKDQEDDELVSIPKSTAGSRRPYQLYQRT